MMKEIHSRKFDHRVTIMLNEYNQPIGPNKAIMNLFSSFLGTLAQIPSLYRIDCKDWRLLKSKEKMWSYAQINQSSLEKKSHKNETPGEMLMNEMSNRENTKRGRLSVVARLMGIGTLPPETIPTTYVKESYDERLRESFSRIKCCEIAKAWLWTLLRYSLVVLRWTGTSGRRRKYNHKENSVFRCRQSGEFRQHLGLPPPGIVIPGCLSLPQSELCGNPSISLLLASSHPKNCLSPRRSEEEDYRQPAIPSNLLHLPSFFSGFEHLNSNSFAAALNTQSPFVLQRLRTPYFVFLVLHTFWHAKGLQIYVASSSAETFAGAPMTFSGNVCSTQLYLLPVINNEHFQNRDDNGK
ncbi:hypothetical protein KSP39_PZI007802 [Platanthera zijinensis]|uniref:Uncharacterized protein n=1 Tax=Platanthera zijinensis TaxID=2320716 RepID=A0AAP0G835_9ASPA